MRPPTDNLYKFLAIFGLLVAGFSIYVPMLKYVELNRLTLHQDALGIPRLKAVNKSLDQHMRKLECSLNKQRAKEGDPALPEYKGACEMAELMLSDAEVARAEEARLESEYSTLQVERDIVWQEYRLFFWVGSSGVALGVGMCIAGFWFWYIRLQRYLDASVKAEALSAGRIRVPSVRRPNRE